MKIIYHHRTQAEDAQGIHIGEMVKAFRDLGHEVLMVDLVKADSGEAAGPSRSVWKYLRKFTPNWFYELMALFYNLYGYVTLARIIKDEKPAFIYERYSLNTFCGVLAGRRFGIPVVLEVNAPLYREQMMLGQLFFKSITRFLERWICSNSTFTITVSEVMKGILSEEGVPSERITVMHNGVDPEKFHPGISGAGIRRRYGLEKSTVVGFVGWFRPWHGLEMLLEVFYSAGLSDRGVKLLLVGDGPAYSGLYCYAKEKELLGSIVFTGPVGSREIPVHVAAMDVVVQPSATAYACPMKLIEYMAMAKCTIAPDQPNIREIISDGESGVLFTPGDRESFLKLLLRVIEDEQLRAQLGDGAFNVVSKRGYYWRSNALKTMELLRKVVQGFDGRWPGNVKGA